MLTDSLYYHYVFTTKNETNISVYEEKKKICLLFNFLHDSVMPITIQKNNTYISEVKRIKPKQTKHASEEKTVYMSTYKPQTLIYYKKQKFELL